MKKWEVSSVKNIQVKTITYVRIVRELEKMENVKFFDSRGSVNVLSAEKRIYVVRKWRKVMG